MPFMRARLLIVALSAAALTTVGGVGGAGAAPNGSVDPVLPPGFPCLNAPVTPLWGWGWIPLDAHRPKYVEGPTGAAGSLELLNTRGSSGQYHAGINTRLTDLAMQRGALSYRYKGNQASYQLRLRGADTTSALSGFTTLVWEPTNNGTAGVSNGWMTPRDLAAGKWWSTSPIKGLPNRDKTLTLSQIAALNPKAFVTAYGVLSSSTTEKSWVDSLKYGCATWDFLPSSAFGS